jgi:AraC family transcriptional regulator
MTVAKIEIVNTEISFIQAYDQSYKENGSFSLFLPIRVLPQGM